MKLQTRNNVKQYAFPEHLFHKVCGFRARILLKKGEFSTRTRIYAREAPEALEKFETKDRKKQGVSKKPGKEEIYGNLQTR